jgi:hypothetical protein
MAAHLVQVVVAADIVITVPKTLTKQVVAAEVRVPMLIYIMVAMVPLLLVLL